MSASVDVGGLFEVVWASLALGLVVSVTFATLLYGAIRSADGRRDGDRAAAMVFGALALLGAAAFAAVVVFGFAIIIK